MNYKLNDFCKNEPIKKHDLYERWEERQVLVTDLGLDDPDGWIPCFKEYKHRFIEKFIVLVNQEPVKKDKFFCCHTVAFRNSKIDEKDLIKNVIDDFIEDPSKLEIIKSGNVVHFFTPASETDVIKYLSSGEKEFSEIYFSFKKEFKKELNH